MPPALLLPSDDSDAEEVDGAMSRRDKRRMDRRCKRTVRLKEAFLLLLITVCLFFAYLSYNQYILKKKFNELNEALSGILPLSLRPIFRPYTSTIPITSRGGGYPQTTNGV